MACKAKRGSGGRKPKTLRLGTADCNGAGRQGVKSVSSSSSLPLRRVFVRYFERFYELAEATTFLAMYAI